MSLAAYRLERFIIPPSLKCRLSIISREVRQALEAEHVKIDGHLLDRCVDVAVGCVGTHSPVKLIASAYTLYKQQLKMTDLEKTRAARKHFAVKYLDKSLPAVDRIFCFIFFKLFDDSKLRVIYAPICAWADTNVLPMTCFTHGYSVKMSAQYKLSVSAMAREIRSVVRETSENNFDDWREKAYFRLSLIPPVVIGIRPTLDFLYIASLRSILIDECLLLKEYKIRLLVVYSEFAEYGYDIAKLFSPFEDLALVIIEHPSISSLPVEVFAQIQKYRFEAMNVCVACDTDGLTVSGLIVARYISLATLCNSNDALKLVKEFHESFIPQPYALESFDPVEQNEDEAKLLDLEAPLSVYQKENDSQRVANEVQSSFK